MTRNRLLEFRPSNQAENDGNDAGMASEVPTTADNTEITKIFKQVGELKRLINDLKSNVDAVKSLQSKILLTPGPNEKTKSELDDLMATVKNSSLFIRAKLKDLQEGNKTNANEEDEVVDVSAEARMRRAQHLAMLRNFIELMNQYQLAQVEYRDKCKERIKRQLEITGANYTDDDVENMIGEGNFDVFTQKILETEQGREMLADVEERHQDILKLEKSLIELRDMFVEMALLVETQGEKVDRIEMHVNSTKDYVAKAKVKYMEAAMEKKVQYDSHHNIWQFCSIV